MLTEDYPQEVECRPDVATTVAPAVPRPHARIAGLDGIRAIAVTAVVLFHADFYWARGGYLGVDLFFVISGFLITSLAAREVEATGQLNLPGFFWRRAKRLLPAVWLMMAAVIGLAAWVARDALPFLRRDTIASIAYLTNWELIRSQASYFEAVGRPPLLQHLWSLAIEEQFYIIWAPLVCIVLPRFGRRVLASLAIVLALASAAWMAWMAYATGYPGQGDASRLYFGTDTHGFAVLFGSALGLIWRPSQHRLSTLKRMLGWLLGPIALIAMVTLFVLMGENASMLYPWGFLVAAGTAIILIGVATHPGLAFGRYLDNTPMRWIGERSYGIYLWHWPIFMLMRPGIDLRMLDGSVVLALSFVLTLIVAECSYRYLEVPIRRGALQRIFGRVNRKAWPARLAVVSSLLLAFGSAGAILWQTPVEAKPAQDVRDALEMDIPAPSVSIPSTVLPVTAASIQMPIEPVTISDDLETVSDEPATPAYTGNDLTAIGDSVLLGSSRLLKISLPGTDVRATMGWQAADVLRQIKALKNTGELRAVALVHLGTNGYVTEKQLRQILTLLSSCKRVVLVNTHVPRRWMEANNELIDSVAPDFPNVVVVRWSDTSDDQPDYFVSDGVHLTAIGQRAFIADIMRTGNLSRDSGESLDPATSTVAQTIPSGDLSPTLVLAPQSAASDAYWRKLARCESDNNWQSSGRHSGGLGIVVGDWQAWGGDQFAPTPARATLAQQIEVANRISTQGWTNAQGEFVKPVGYARWRCVAAIGSPPLGSPYTYTRESVLAQAFHLGERGAVVRDLQRILGVVPDGIYSEKLRKKHLAYLRQNALPENLAGINQ